MRVFHRSNKGFTLVEIMIVVAIIALIAAIAIPNFLRARHNANETGAVGALRTLSTALESYRAAQTPPTYPVLLSQLSASSTLMGPSYVPTSLTSATGSGTARQGYFYTFVWLSINTYNLQATPAVVGTTGTRRFHVDETGVIRANQFGPATRTSAEIQ